MSGFQPTRRTTLAWLSGAIAAACSRDTGAGNAAVPRHRLAPAANASGQTYGYDPDRLMPTVPWPLTMSAPQLALTARLSALIIPADATGPSAEDVGAQHYVDEWVSAPYAEQKEDRTAILSLLDSIESDCRERFGVAASEASVAQLQSFLDEFAWAGNVAEERAADASAFSRLRRIVIGVYATSEPGRTDLGYQGNVPILGPYPGPSGEALDHLKQALQEIGLAL